MFAHFLTPGFVLFVTRAKYAISFLKPVHGRVPARPMPILFVAATMRVRSRGPMLGSSSLRPGRSSSTRGMVYSSDFLEDQTAESFQKLLVVESMFHPIVG
jgi:hypothetical protein